ncbi:MAG: flavodoxin [Breznakia sp.]
MEKILVVYYSMTGNTEMMANAIKEGLNGSADVTSVKVGDKPPIEGYDKIMFGCAAAGAEVLDDSEFDPYFSDIEKYLSGKKVALFGSYDWGDGTWMRDWQDRVLAAGAQLFEEGLKINLVPDEAGLETCRNFAKRFAQF